MYLLDMPIKIELTEDKKNALVGRREIKFRVIQDKGTPSRKEVRENMIALLQCKPELLVIDGMHTEFGKKEITGYAKLYDTEDRMKVIEREHILARNASKEEPKGA
jgi:small subunit ribosomal protein S24e